MLSFMIGGSLLHWAVPVHSAAQLTVCASGCAYNSIQAAINDAEPDSTISVASGVYVENLTLYAKRLTINGADANTTILSGGNQGRVLFLYANTTLTLTSVTVRDGWIRDNQGGGIYSDGQLTVNASRIISNQASLSGGGIANFGTLLVNRSIITNNTALMGNGGGIISGGSLQVNESTLAGNQAKLYGGGIYHGVGTFTLINSTISGNSAGVSGGGIANFDRITSANSTISTNRAQIAGGGIVNGGAWVMNSMTLAENLGGDGDSLYNSGALTIENSIVINKLAAGNCTNLGIVVSLGHNLDNGTTCAFHPPADLVGQNPLLGPLANNGGVTPTHALLPGSPAINAGSNACPPPTTDQRGVIRPQSVRCDIGAYEAAQPGSNDNSGKTQSGGAPQPNSITLPLVVK
ncbi:MAG: choice-of-anchor Q domain-containing protein [Caldilineaceae bacterium]